MIVLCLQPIVEEVPPQTLEESGTLVLEHKGGVIARHMITPHVVDTYAHSASFPCTILQLE
jgi:hypothetical protein